MQFNLRLFITALAFVFFNSCASIFSKGTYPLVVSTDPAEAEIVISTPDGQEIYTGQSPATVELEASAGFLKKATYEVTIKKHGYAEQKIPLTYKIDGWYWGNLLLGGVVGMLIIDPATGAMFKPTKEYLNIKLKVKYDFTKGGFVNKPPNGQLRIYDLADVSESLRPYLVQINK